MAQNKTMAIKHAMAKKWAMKEVMENAKAEMCAFPKDTTQKKINTIMGYHYPEEKFCKDFVELYKFIKVHNIQDIKKYIQSFIH